MSLIDEQIKVLLDQRLQKLEEHFDSDVAFYFGPIQPGLQKIFRDFMEKLRRESARTAGRFTLVLNTPGGSAEAAEKLVDIIRFHYAEVNFIVPDYAMSAGTIFCMAGDKIFMDYSSSLGPIDPQVPNGQDLVPALGYLDQVEKMIAKSQVGTLSNAEFLMLQNLDLAMLRRYEQARDLTVTLLKKWLVEYKFKDWTVHQSNPDKIGKAVTLDEKRERAEEIARMLGDNKLWHSHGRMIGVQALRDVLKLKIEDYSNDHDLRHKIRSYNDLLTEFIAQRGIKIFLHSKNYF